MEIEHLILFQLRSILYSLHLLLSRTSHIKGEGVWSFDIIDTNGFVDFLPTLHPTIAYSTIGLADNQWRQTPASVLCVLSSLQNRKKVITSFSHHYGFGVSVGSCCGA